MSEFTAAMFVRGEVIEEDLVQFGGRGGGVAFRAPDPHRHLERLPLGNPTRLSDLYDLRFEEILDFLEEVGRRLVVPDNPHLAGALRACARTSDLTPAVLEAAYAELPLFFEREAVREMVERRIGVPYLEGWVEQPLRDGRIVAIRAFGARALHIVAGNVPGISALSIVRNAVTRSDAIIKTPSNDPLTALAIARTMAEVDADHPLTRHLSVAYWKGGDEELERRLYRPEHIEKILAWGGFASVKHVTRYVQPGLELVSLDPKRSATIIGAEAFASEEVMREVALRTAADIGALNQEMCVNARVVYAVTGTDEEGLATVNRFGGYVHEALTRLPSRLSTPPKRLDPELKGRLAALRLDDEWYRVIGGEADEGAIVVSQLDEPVDFVPLLSGRVANLVPVDDVKDVLRGINSYTQTIGIYPEGLKKALRDALPIHGAQRLVSLGYAAHGSAALPQDGIEPLRRMCKWISEESSDPEHVKPLWR